MTPHTVADDLDLVRLRDRIDATLADFLARPCPGVPAPGGHRAPAPAGPATPAPAEPRIPAQREPGTPGTDDHRVPVPDDHRGHAPRDPAVPASREPAASVPRDPAVPAPDGPRAASGPAEHRGPVPQGGPGSGAAADGPGIDLLRALADFVLAPGKRIRPLLCVLGWHTAAGHDSEQVLRLAASLEIFHAFALIHDDIMDGSDTRRGRPSVHRAFAAHRGHRADADAFGTSTAILLGDLALVRCDEMLRTARLSPRQAAATLPLLEAMRHEVLQGQYLDLATAGRPSGDLERALRVIRLKTAKYTIERPLHLGAALAGARGEVLRACSAFALPLGDAFQLRDDLLGVFGDPGVTGKPVLEDLRCGKATVLMAIAVRRASPAQAALLHRLVGDPRLDEDAAAEVRRVLEDTGARRAVETMIDKRYDAALRALAGAGFPPRVTRALRRIAAGAVARDA